MSPSTTLMVVVFPAPLGPNRPKTSPGATARSTPLRISTARRRKPTWTVLRRSRTESAAAAVKRALASRYREPLVATQVADKHKAARGSRRRVRVVALVCAAHHVRAGPGVRGPVLHICLTAGVDQPGAVGEGGRVRILVVDRVGREAHFDVVRAAFDGSILGLVPLVEEHRDRDRGQD